MRRLSYLNSATPSAISAISSAATGRPYANNREAGDMFAEIMRQTELGNYASEIMRQKLCVRNYASDGTGTFRKQFLKVPVPSDA